MRKTRGAACEQNGNVSKDVTTALNHIIDVAGQAATIMNGSINSKKREFLKTILSNGVLTDKSACFYLKNLRQTAFCEGL